MHSWTLQDQKNTGVTGSFLCQFGEFDVPCGGTYLHTYAKVLILLILRAAKGQDS